MQDPTSMPCSTEQLPSEHFDRIMCLKQQIERILEMNCISLEQRLKYSQNCQSSIEQVFTLISDEYHQKQQQISTLGRLVRNDNSLTKVHTIDLLTQEIQEKSELVSNYDQELQDKKRELANAERCIIDYSNQLQECSFAKSLLERDLMEANEVRERYQGLYEEAVNSNKEEEGNQNQSTNQEVSRRESLPNDSFSQQQQKRQLQVMLLQYQLRQLKSQLSYKDTLITQKQTARQQLLDRLRSQTQKSTAIHNNFKLLQENFRFAISENQELKRNVCDLEQKLEQVEGDRMEFGVGEVVVEVEGGEGREPVMRRVMSRENVVGVGVTSPKNGGGGNSGVSWMLRRSQSHFSIPSEKGSENPASRLNTLAAQMKAFDTESNQALNRNQYKFTAAQKSVRFSDLDQQPIRSPRALNLNILSPRAINIPILTLPIPQNFEPDHQNHKLSMSICSTCGCSKSKPLIEDHQTKTQQRGWLLGRVQSLFEEIRQHAVTRRIQRHCHHKK